MHFQVFDYATGKLIGPLSASDSTAALDFGDLIQGQHCSKPVLVQAVTDNEVSVTDSILFLENKGLWKDSQFGYFMAADKSLYVSPNPPIEAGGAMISNHFIEAPNASQMTPCPPGVPLNFNGNASDYVWLDIQVFQTGATQAGYRLFFNFA